MQAPPLTPGEFAAIAARISAETGIQLDARRSDLLRLRLNRRLRQLKLDSFRAYCRILDDRSAVSERVHLIAAATTNETWFFRNAALWRQLAEEIVPGLVKSRRKGERRLRIWSAACSSGEEPYSLAILLRECLPDFDAWRISIVGSDISEPMLARARVAVYDHYAAASAGESRLARWFTRQGRSYRLRSEIRRMASFGWHDVRKPISARPFDLVLMRNVLMYFDLPSRVAALRAAARAVAPGGFLVIGDIDSIPAQPALHAILPWPRVCEGIYCRPRGATVSRSSARGIQAPLSVL